MHTTLSLIWVYYNVMVSILSDLDKFLVAYQYVKLLNKYHIINF